MRPEIAESSADGVAAITIDLHDGDDPVDIRVACELLKSRDIRATFFVPTGMLSQGKYRIAVREIVSHHHEAASHSHLHDYLEMRALMRGRQRDLRFLSVAKAIHEDTFGVAPSSFRSPCWCHLGPAAVAELAELGYSVDSSATPQRLGVFSSMPFENVWTFAPRHLRYIAPSLLEVPTSTFLVPAGSPTFSIIRSGPAGLLVRALAFEGRRCSRRVLSVQFHPHAFNPLSTHTYGRPARLTARSFWLTAEGGFEFKHFLRSSDVASTVGLTKAILGIVAPFQCLRMSEIAAAARDGRLGFEPRLNGDPIHE
jgi:hypothetical protein